VIAHLLNEPPDEGLDASRCLEQVNRLLASPGLQSSEALCKLLHYLAEYTLNRPDVHLKEYQIATEVFGRPADFNPQLDSTVRVQAGRLRTKLAEYYNSVGLHDPILVDLPKGKYSLWFHLRPSPITQAAPLEILPGSRRPSGKVQAAHRYAVLILSVLLAACLGIVFALYATRQDPQFPGAQANSVPASFRFFWSPFLVRPDPPSVVFSNAAFVGRSDTGMRYFDPVRDSRDQIVEHYTGVGEVLAVLELDRMFRQFGRQFRAKRGSLFTLDDAQNSDLIFIGSPAENLTLVEIPNTREFIFQRVKSGLRRGDLAIANLHPKPGEDELFLPTAPNQPMDVDYALIALLHGLSPSRWMLILAGTSTIGTQAATEYVCRPDSVEQLLRQINISKGSALQPFEALLRVSVRRDVPVASTLITVRKTR